MSWGEVKKIITDLTKVFTDETESVKNDIVNVKNDVSTIPRTAVKSVQRGKANMYSKGASTMYGDFTISSVNMQKSFVLVNLYPNSNDNKLVDTKPYIGYLMNSTTIRIYCSEYRANLSSTGIFVDWQVIEFE